MTHQEFVDYFLDTYDMSPRRRETIRRVTLSRISELGINSPKQLHEYVDYLVNNRFPNQGMLSLDSPAFPDSDTTFHELIGVQDPLLENLFKDEPPEGLSYQEVMDVLGDRLERVDVALLSTVLKRTNSEEPRFNISYDQLMASIEQIDGRLQEVIHRYERDGRLVMPNRDIISISFNPLSIRLGRGRLSQEQIYRLTEILYEHKGDVKIVAKETGHAIETVIKYAGIAGIDIQYEKLYGKQLPQTERDRIVQSLRENRFDKIKASIETGYSPGTVERYAAEAGVKIRPRKRRKYHHYNEEDKSRMTQAYHDFGHSATKASRYVPYSHTSLLRHWKSEGFEILSRGRTSWLMNNTQDTT